MITDAIARHAMSRAADNIAVALGTDEGTQNTRRVKAFCEAARLTALNGKDLHAAFEGSNYPLVQAMVQKAAAANTLSGAWATDGARALAQAFIQSIAPGDALTQIARYARPIPVSQRHAMVATGFSASQVNEGAAKVCKTVSLSVDPERFRKLAAIIVCTKELLMTADPAAMALFETELASAVLRGSNQAIVDALTDSTTTGVSASTDALADLRAGLRAAGASAGYVVIASRTNTQDLATRVEAAPDFGAAGGDFRPGISIVPQDDFTGMAIIPASRLAVYSSELELRNSGEGDISMADSPTSPSNMVSLFQTGSVGVIAERQFHIAGDVSGIVRVS